MRSRRRHRGAQSARSRSRGAASPDGGMYRVRTAGTERLEPEHVAPLKPLLYVGASVNTLDRLGSNLYDIAYISKTTPMDAITYTTARANLAHTMDRVCEDHEPLIITRNGQQSVVMMSLDDFKALEETAYLLRAPKNAKRLLEAIASLENGQGKERRLAE